MQHTPGTVTRLWVQPLPVTQREVAGKARTPSSCVLLPLKTLLDSVSQTSWLSWLLLLSPLLPSPTSLLLFPFLSSALQAEYCNKLIFSIVIFDFPFKIGSHYLAQMASFKLVLFLSPVSVNLGLHAWLVYTSLTTYQYKAHRHLCTNRGHNLSFPHLAHLSLHNSLPPPMALVTSLHGLCVKRATPGSLSRHEQCPVQALSLSTMSSSHGIVGLFPRSLHGCFLAFNLNYFF